MFHEIGSSPAVEQGLPNRAGVLCQMYHSLCSSMGNSISSAGLSGFDRAGTKVAHPLLARTLLADPSVSAILPSAQAPVALGLAEHERIAGFVHIGRASASPEDRPRPPLDTIATRFADR